jgi:hypothetical protein
VNGVLNSPAVNAKGVGFHFTMPLRRLTVAGSLAPAEARISTSARYVNLDGNEPAIESRARWRAMVSPTCSSAISRAWKQPPSFGAGRTDAVALGVAVSHEESAGAAPWQIGGRAYASPARTIASAIATGWRADPSVSAARGLAALMAAVSGPWWLSNTL